MYQAFSKALSYGCVALLYCSNSAQQHLLFQKFKTMDNSNISTTMNNINVFDNRFLSAKNLYMHYFGTLPNLNYISCVDGEKAYNAFKEKYSESIKHVHQYHWFEHKKKKYQFDKTMVVMQIIFLWNLMMLIVIFFMMANKTHY